ncbi:hypothetical protein YC2023_107461 [Brassica napus]
MISFHISTFERILYLLDPSRKGFYKHTTKKGISKSKPSFRKAPPKHAATQVSDAMQQEMLISHGFFDVNVSYLSLEFIICRFCIYTHLPRESLLTGEIRIAGTTPSLDSRFGGEIP